MYVSYMVKKSFEKTKSLQPFHPTLHVALSLGPLILS